MKICQLIPKLVGGTNIETHIPQAHFSLEEDMHAEESTPFLDGYREIFTRGQSNRSVHVISHLHIVSNLRNRDILPPRLPLHLYG
jgi:hypothetical protein